MDARRVRQLRVVLNTEDMDGGLAFFRDALGLPEEAAFGGPEGARVVILDAGRATLELSNPAQARFIAAVETGGVPSSPVRLAFEVGDTAAVTDALTAAGAPLIAAPVRTPWESLNARLAGPDGLHVTIFQELAVEADLLRRAVVMAREHGASGQLPFAALVVRDGEVIGTGVNTAVADRDPTAHAEVAAVRDACRRTGSVDLGSAVVYASGEPCAICRTVAAASGVREIVYAAGKELVPTEIDATPEATARLIEAVSAELPGIARRGEAGMSAAELAAPFAAYLAATAGS